MKTVIEVPFRVGNDIYFMHKNKIVKDCIDQIVTKTMRNSHKTTILVKPMKKDAMLFVRDCFDTRKECLDNFIKK